MLGWPRSRGFLAFLRSSSHIDGGGDGRWRVIDGGIDAIDAQPNPIGSGSDIRELERGRSRGGVERKRANFLAVQEPRSPVPCPQDRGARGGEGERGTGHRRRAAGRELWGAP